MRLASKIFLTSSLVILVLAGVGVISLRAVGRLVSVNREITTQTVPALRVAGSLRDQLLSLERLAARFDVLRDPRYAAVWHERASRVQADLERLRQLVRTPDERARLTDAAAAFDAYRAAVLAEHARAARAPGAADPPSRALGDRVETALDGLMEAMYARVLAGETESAQLEARTWARVLAALAAAVGLALLGTGLLAYRMTRSLRRLSAATAAVASGSYRDPIDDSARDEIGALARSFNAMAAQLRRMDETKEEFFATLSHELRSPLTSVREAAHLLRDGVPGVLNAKQARLVTLVERSTDRLLRLVNQILELSRLRAGVLPLSRERVDLARVVGRAVEELRPQAEEGGLSLTRERVGDRFDTFGDEDRLVQVVVNLVANAVRFTPRGGRVTVRLVDAGAEVEIQVEDTGVGIPATALPYIFESWRQAHRDRGGTGLGLAVVRGVVQAHGGRVTVESQEGKGSRFTVLLPRAPEAAA
ncbi:MAG TPA: HAMP domain-containing sensor histidine kinase [Methylomirabilota bacterium]|jgi:signal transduction histidine kinase|nr:HAMP domain-containing sensor histidine kinase [Methylomirabilota bacterium]